MSAVSLACDIKLNDLVAAALQQSPYFARRPLCCQAERGRVVLRGTVTSFYHKQMAQEILRRVDGVDRIENHLEVDWSPAAAQAPNE
jgi:osmotically-inducible protein OsmY